LKQRSVGRLNFGKATWAMAPFKYARCSGAQHFCDRGRARTTFKHLPSDTLLEATFRNQLVLKVSASFSARYLRQRDRHDSTHAYKQSPEGASGSSCSTPAPRRGPRSGSSAAGSWRMTRLGLKALLGSLGDRLQKPLWWPDRQGLVHGWGRRAASWLIYMPMASKVWCRLLPCTLDP
jgi:hypothetical protein